MTLDDFLSTLDYDTGKIFVVQNLHVSMPVPGWLLDVHEYIRIDDYVPDDLLLAKVVRIRTNTHPWTVAVDL